MTLNRRSVYALLGVIAVAIACSQILSAQRVYDPATQTDKNWPKARPKPLPMYGSNDRSRWATVRALVDDGTYVIGRREVHADWYKDSGIIFEDGWQSVDKVLHPETNEFYSSKPPLLSTLVAGLYWLLQLLTGWRFVGARAEPLHANEIVRSLLLIINGVPFAIYLWQLGRLVED